MVIVHLCVQIGGVICVLCVCTCAWVKGICLHDTLYVPVNKYMYM